MHVFLNAKIYQSCHHKLEKKEVEIYVEGELALTVCPILYERYSSCEKKKFKPFYLYSRPQYTVLDHSRYHTTSQ